jgi:hypothetical protein
MYIPAAPAQLAATLVPVGIASAPAALTSPPLGGSTSTAVSVRWADLNVLENHPATVAGALRTAPDDAAPRLGSAPLPHRTVMLQALGGGGWSTVARGESRAEGAFVLPYVPRQPGSTPVRLDFGGDLAHSGARRTLGRLNVYRLAEASWYGAGGELACGGSLTSSTLGVANRTLPCGTLVRLRYRGRSVRVPVVDRGPFVAGREFDLTPATRLALGFGDTGEVWSTR